MSRLHCSLCHLSGEIPEATPRPIVGRRSAPSEQCLSIYSRLEAWFIFDSTLPQAIVSLRLLLGSALATTTTTLVQTCSVVQDVNFPGNDIGSTEQTDPSNCCHDCQATPHCKGFNWDGGVCYLKSEKGQAVPSIGTFSGFITPSQANATTLVPQPTQSMVGTCSVHKNVDFAGNDIKATYQNSATKCCADCQATVGCKIYNWYDGVCSLKSGKGKSSRLLGAISGVLSYQPASTPAPTPQPTPVTPKPTPAPTPAPTYVLSRGAIAIGRDRTTCLEAPAGVF
ncbi:Aste57867_2330 [Aphanomyces stellatus]|uniref:Aste57867_2330 protein n=1 Tax=Aphanomyces stellatus TaxID=120398 RepID=A0A485K8E1_9STRA|nr:hypothetical protein As57867_002325 [Aphanomyces stellatus]VFT79532.1 Aste57867_2330 [Aphanomyces stellatus]